MRSPPRHTPLSCEEETGNVSSLNQYSPAPLDLLRCRSGAGVLQADSSAWRWRTSDAWKTESQRSTCSRSERPSRPLWQLRCLNTPLIQSFSNLLLGFNLFTAVLLVKRGKQLLCFQIERKLNQANLKKGPLTGCKRISTVLEIDFYVFFNSKLQWKLKSRKRLEMVVRNKRTGQLIIIWILIILIIVIILSLDYKVGTRKTEHLLPRSGDRTTPLSVRWGRRTLFRDDCCPRVWICALL